MDSRALAKKILGTTGIQLFAKALAVITGVVYARYLGPTEYGLYGYVLSIVTLLTLPAIAGLPNFLVREIANYQLEKRWSYLRGIITWSQVYILVVSLSIVIITSIAISYGFFDENIVGLLQVALILVPIKGLVTNEGAILNGFRMPILSQLPTKIFIPTITIFIIFSCIMMGFEINGYLIFEVSILGSFCALIISRFMSIRTIIKNSSKARREYKISTWHKSLAPFTLMAIVGVLNVELAVLFLGYFGSIESVAYFKVAMQGTLLISLGLASINTVIMPQVARFYREGKLSKTQDLLTKSVRFSALISIPIIIILMFFGEFFISLLFGSEYTQAYLLLFILCIGQLFNVLMGSVGLVLNMTSNEQSALVILAFVFFVNVVLFFVLIPPYGAVGAAISVSVSHVLSNVITALMVKNKTKLITWIR